MALGQITINGGPYSGKEGIVYIRRNEVWILVKSVFTKTRINLSQELANYEAGASTHTSTKRVLTRGALTGLAGSLSSRGTSWALLGVASGLKLEKNRYHIAIRLKNGDVIAGETNTKVIDTIKRISPGLSDDQVIQMGREKERLQRFIEDAPRTIHEVRENIDRITKEMEILEPLRTEASTFDARESAQQKYGVLKRQLDEQLILQGMLEARIRGESTSGSVDVVAPSPIDQEIERLQKRLKFPIWYFSAAWILFAFETNFSVGMGLCLVGYSGYLLFKRPSTREAIQSLTVEREKLLAEGSN